MQKFKKISISSLIILIGFSISVGFHYIKGIYLEDGYPYNTFLFIPSARFGDFFNIFKIPKSPYSLPNDILKPLFPFAVWIEKLFSSIGNGTLSFIIFIFLFISFLFYVCYINLKTKNLIANIRNIFIFLFLTYPVLFSLDRGNFEILVFIFMYFFIMLYYKNKTLFANIFLIFAICMKLFPAVFLLLYIIDKKFREASIVIISSVVITLSSYALFPGGLLYNISTHLKSLKLYNKQYSIADSGLMFGHSLWGTLKVFFKAISYFFHNSWAIDNIIVLSKYYVFLAIIIFLLLACYIIFVEKLFWKKIFILTTSICVLPYVSADYKLLHLFIPLFLFINYNTSLSNKANGKSIIKSSSILEKKYRFDLFYIIIFGLLMIPKDYYILFNDVSISVILNPFLMILMTIVIIVEGFINKNNLKQQTLPAKNIIL